ncbi:MAG TPA: MFS transporter [Blastocatellia bacterium]|nr:MFS transporter [Blastocatellia bacterium]
MQAPVAAVYRFYFSMPERIVKTSESAGAAKRRSLATFAIDVTPLKASRDYRLLYTGQFVSGFGSAISFVVLPWQMYQLTKSSFAVGMLGVAEFVPMLLMAFVGGALADYIDRRRLIILSELGLTLCCAILVLNSLLARPRGWVLFLISAMFAALNGIHRPALEALTPRLVDPHQLPAVSALSILRYNFNFIVGPAIAGLIAASLGAAVVFAIDAATFLVSIAMLLLIRSIPVPVVAERASLRSVVEGLKYARSRQELLGTYLIDLNAMFFGMPMALFPALADSFGGASVGLFYAMPAVGSLVATLTSGWSGRVDRHGLAVTIAATVWGVAIICFGLMNSLWLALFFLALAGAADTVSGLFRMTIWNQTIPDYLRGRLAGIEMISYTTGPYLGNAEAGLVASLFGLRASVVSGGVLCVLGSALLALSLPAFLRYSGREGLERKQAEESRRARESNNRPAAS